jgi:3-isopropylmalate dehydrogenase
MDYKIALIPGDGIGPEIVREAKKVLDKVCEKYGHSFSYSEVLLGGASIYTAYPLLMRQLPLPNHQTPY